MKNPVKLTELLDRPIVLRILFFVTFALIFLSYTFPLGLSDFWWHLNTGRWIWNQQAIPVDDPFLFSSPVPLDQRATMILHGYPLFQVLIFGAYTWAGLYALVLLKGLLMTLTFGLLWAHLRRNGMQAMLALAIVGLLSLLFFRFDDFRPQQFSFVFVLLVLLLIESTLWKARQGIATRKIWFLPIIMLAWANLHGAFMIGMAILMIYWFAAWVARIRHSEAALTDSAYRRFWIIIVLSLGATILNPAGLTAIPVIFTSLSGAFPKVIDEYFPTIQYFEFHGIPHFGYLIVAVAVIPAVALLFKLKQISLPHALLLIPFLVAGIMSFRFSLLMVTVVITIASAYYSQALNRWFIAYKGIPLVFLGCISIGLLGNTAFSRTSLFNTPLETRMFPTQALAYLKQTKLTGNVFNYFEYGGYLGWQLYPQKVFTDARGLSWQVYEEYSKVWRGDYAQVFKKYQITAVVYPVREGYARKLPRLLVGLFRDNEWEISYYDGRDAIFVNKNAYPSVPFLDKQGVANDIAKRL